MASNDAKRKVLVTRNIGQDALGLLRARTDLELVLWDNERRPTRDWVLEHAPGVEGMLVLMSEKVDDEMLDAAGPQLRVVSTLSVGHDHIDKAALAKRNIVLGNTPDVLTDAVADLTVMLTLMAGRNAGQGQALVLDGKWPTTVFSLYTLCGPQLSTLSGSGKRTVGFVGFGRIAQATLRRLVPFGIQTCLYAGSPRTNPESVRERDVALGGDLGLCIERVQLDEVAQQSDVVIILCPGSDETYHLIGESFLRKMKPTAILVNVARGTVVDSNALATALQEQWIWGAGVDVVEGEPNVTQDHPLVREPRCVVLPHLGTATLDTRVGMAKLAAMNVINGVSGQPLVAGVDLTSYKPATV